MKFTHQEGSKAVLPLRVDVDSVPGNDERMDSLECRCSPWFPDRRVLRDDPLVSSDEKCLPRVCHGVWNDYVDC